MPSGSVFDIQSYAVHDGPGIRTLVFLKGCPLACRWCCNPESQLPHPELRHHAFRCRSCLRCAAACPLGAVAASAEGPVVDRSRCHACDAWPCVEACPEDALLRVGRAMEADEVVGLVARDLPFYRNSGGGVTFSGGEPFHQPAFLLALLGGCRELGIHTAVETCGHAPTAAMLEAEPLVDLFLYDLKVMDPRRHEALTGRGNGLVLENLRVLSELRPDRVVVRLAVVPGCNDDEANLDATARFVASLRLPVVNLSPYHLLGAEKYRGLGREYRCTADPGTLDPRRIAAIGERFARCGIAWEVA